jgi:hypothetical protein
MWIYIRHGGQTLYIPLAIHKNELVVIDGMDTFSQFFCLAKKQKMTPLASDTAAQGREEIEGDEEIKPFFGESSDSLSSDSDEEDL